MRAWPIRILLAGSFLIAAAGVRAETLRAGDPFPQTSLRLEDAGGIASRIEDLRGDGGTLVVFTSNTCSDARDREARTVTLARRYASLGVTTVWVNSSDPERVPGEDLSAMRRRASEIGLGRYLADVSGAVARTFGVTVAPEAFLFDPKGYLVYRGAIDDAADVDAVRRSHLAEALDEMFRGERISVPSTSPVGCEVR